MATICNWKDPRPGKELIFIFSLFYVCFALFYGLAVLLGDEADLLMALGAVMIFLGAVVGLFVSHYFPRAPGIPFLLSFFVGMTLFLATIVKLEGSLAMAVYSFVVAAIGPLSAVFMTWQLRGTQEQLTIQLEGSYSLDFYKAFMARLEDRLRKREYDLTRKGSVLIFELPGGTTFGFNFKLCKRLLGPFQYELVLGKPAGSREYTSSFDNSELKNIIRTTAVEMDRDPGIESYPMVESLKCGSCEEKVSHPTVPGLPTAPDVFICEICGYLEEEGVIIRTRG